MKYFSLNITVANEFGFWMNLHHCFASRATFQILEAHSSLPLLQIHLVPTPLVHFTLFLVIFPLEFWEHNINVIIQFCWEPKSTHSLCWNSLKHCFYHHLFPCLREKIVLPIVYFLPYPLFYSSKCILIFLL